MSKHASTQNPAGSAAAELRKLTREAHEAASDLTAAVKAARAQVEQYTHDEVQRALNDYTTAMQEQMSAWNRDARADGQRLINSLAEACAQIVTVVNLGLTDELGRIRHRADVVMDLRGDTPVIYQQGDPQGQAVLDQAEYMVVIDPEQRSTEAGRPAHWRPS